MENLYINRLYEKFAQKLVKKDGTEEFYRVRVPYAESKDGFASICVNPSHVIPTKYADGSVEKDKVNIMLGWPVSHKTISICTDIGADGSRTYEKVRVTNRQILDGFLKKKAEFQSSLGDMHKEESRADPPEAEEEMSLQELIALDDMERGAGITDRKQILDIFRKLSECPLESAVTERLLDFSLDYLKEGGYIKQSTNVSDLTFGEFFDRYYREMVDYAISQAEDKESRNGSEGYPACLLPRLDSLTITMFKFFESFKDRWYHSGLIQRFLKINYGAFLDTLKEEYGMSIVRADLKSGKEPEKETLEDVITRVCSLCTRVYIPELDMVKFRQDTRMGYAIMLLSLMNPLFVISNLAEAGAEQQDRQTRENCFLPADMSSYCRLLQNSYQQIA